jgi:hypothetical protein
MSVVDGGSSGLVQRVQDILLRPKPTWDVIDAEPATVKGLYTGYICILAAIGPVCGVIGGALFGGAGFALFALVGAVVSYLLALVGVYVVSLIVDALAPSFGGTKNPIQALKVVAYASTAAWVASVFNLIPFIGWIGALAGAIYSIYLLYLGLPRLMKTPDDKAAVYTLVTVAIVIVVQIVIGMVVGVFAVMGLAGNALATGAFNS